MKYSQNRYHLNLFDSEVLKRLGPVWWDLLAPRGVGQGLGILNLFTTHHLSCEITQAPKSKVSFPAGTPSTPGHKPANKASLFPPMNQRPGFSEFLIGVTNWISKTLGGVLKNCQSNWLGIFESLRPDLSFEITDRELSRRGRCYTSRSKISMVQYGQIHVMLESPCLSSFSIAKSPFFTSRSSIFEV